MKILYATDLHGDINKYEKLLSLAVDNDYKVIVNGGDMLPKNCDTDIEQSTFINECLRDYFKSLEEHNVTCLVMLGNDDLMLFDKQFADICSKFPNVHNIAQSKVTIAGYEFIGMNYILDHPFTRKNRVVMEDNYISEEQLDSFAEIFTDVGYKYIYNWFEYAETQLPRMNDILSALPKASNNDKTVYITHMPPASLKLGQLLHKDLDRGSADIYNFLKTEQPLLSLHGHIHESPDTMTGKWLNTIGKTTCIQPGQTEINDSTLIYADIDLANKIYKREKVTVNTFYRK